MRLALQQLGQQTWVRTGPVNQGIIGHGNGSCTIVDPGLDRGAARKLLRDVEELSWRPARVFCTHAHADHAGGSLYLAEKTGAPVWAPPVEAALVENPFLEPFSFFAGAAPPPELQNKFLQAPAVRVQQIVEPGTVTPEGFRFVALPGHSPGQMGIRTPDGVFFAADAFFGQRVLQQHPVPYFADVTRALASMKMLEEEEGITWWVPGHGEPVPDLRLDLQANLGRLRAIQDSMRIMLEGDGLTREEVAARLAQQHNMALDAPQYHLLLAATGAHLSHLRGDGELDFRFDQGRMVWKVESYGRATGART